MLEPGVLLSSYSSDPVERAGECRLHEPLPAVRHDGSSFKMSEDAKFALGY
jgi:hypothetical protein